MFGFKSSRDKCPYDLLLVGLGNPGIEYEKTRHNVGFRAMDAFCDKHDAECDKMKYKAYIGECKIGGKRIFLAKPLTYMNNSGESVAEIVKFYKIPVDRILVMFDDISLEPGVIRIRRKGSAGGHNGLKDIIAHLGSDEFMRIKIGVGAKPNPDYDLKDWVLGKFPPDKVEDVENALKNTVKAVDELIANGIDSAMNKYSK